MAEATYSRLRRLTGHRRPWRQYITSMMFVFIIGTGRCGSTLVHELLARHPDVGFVSNLENRAPRLPAGATRWNNSLYGSLSGGMPSTLSRGRWRFKPSEAYGSLERHVSPMVVAPMRDLVAADASPWLAERFQAFFETRAKAQGRPVFLHKFTGWPRTGFIDAVFPDARFIHVVRDGRAVANSWLQMRWWNGYKGPSGWFLGPLPEAYAREFEASGGSFVLLAGLAWKLLMDAFDKARSAVPPDQWLDVRIEDVNDDPRGQVATMLKFVGLEWTSAFEEGFARHSFHSSRKEAFRRDLDPTGLALLERSLRDHLEAWRYPVRAD
jgi:hypothetical protein